MWLSDLDLRFGAQKWYTSYTVCDLCSIRVTFGLSVTFFLELGAGKTGRLTETRSAMLNAASQKESAYIWKRDSQSVKVDYYHSLHKGGTYGFGNR